MNRRKHNDFALVDRIYKSFPSVIGGPFRSTGQKSQTVRSYVKNALLEGGAAGKILTLEEMTKKLNAGRDILNEDGRWVMINPNLVEEEKEFVGDLTVIPVPSIFRRVDLIIERNPHGTYEVLKLNKDKPLIISPLALLFRYLGVPLLRNQTVRKGDPILARDFLKKRFPRYFSSVGEVEYANKWTNLNLDELSSFVA